VTDPRERVTTDPGIGPVEPDSFSTMRSMVAADEAQGDGSAGRPVYYEPTPLQAPTNHKTLEIETIKLSQEIDPRKLPTELSLPRSAGAAPVDSGWPQAEVAVTTSPPLSVQPRRWRVPALLLALLGAVLLLVLARARARLPGAEGDAPNTVQRSGVPAQQAPVALEQAPAPPIAPSSTITVGEPPAPSAAPTPDALDAPGAPAALSTPEVPAAAVSGGASERALPLVGAPSASSTAAHPSSWPPHNSAKASLPPSPSHEPASAPSSAKPKRAIY
jgi:hypothetical protein